MIRLQDARKAGEGTNYPLDLARIGTLLIVFAILKGIVIHVVTVVLIITSIFLLPAHERLLRARKEGPIVSMPRVSPHLTCLHNSP